MRRALFLFVLLGPLLLSAAPPASMPLRFEVTVARGLLPGPTDGRLLVVLGKKANPEPRASLHNTAMDAPPVLGVDASGLAPGVKVVVDRTAAIFPLARLEELPAGDYVVQVLFTHNPDLRVLDAPGNLYGKPKAVRLDPARSGTVALKLDRAFPAEQLPEKAEHLAFFELRSERLSKFHGRPIFLRAGVILPSSYTKEKERKYPLRVHIGGFGTRYTGVIDLMEEDSPFRKAWLARRAPQMVLLHLDGAGPFGDPYQVDSANNGPYGDAITQELIPHVEKAYRCIGAGWARTLDGHSTGGWVSLALQIFYPDFFAGAWAHCPDPVDFRSFELIDIYTDRNAYVNKHGFERPSTRDLDGETRTTVRHEVRHEVVLGRADRWELSGKDWASWNAVFGPRGKDGLPVPLWDAKGTIDPRVAAHYRKYDLRHHLETNWESLAPKLRGKLRIWVGEADEYHLNNAVRRLDDFLKTKRPGLDARITFAPGKGHGWRGVTAAQTLRQMAEAVEKARPK